MNYDHPVLETPPIRGHRMFGTSGGVFHLWPTSRAAASVPVATPTPASAPARIEAESTPTKATQTDLF